MTGSAYLLLVEDSPADVELVLHAARECEPPIRIELAFDGEQALELLLGIASPADAPAAVLLDLRLPGMSGFEVLDAIRAEPELVGLPVVVFSGSDEPADVEESYRRGASSYIRKPSGHRTLVRQLQMLASYWIAVNIPTGPARVSLRSRRAARPPQA